MFYCPETGPEPVSIGVLNPIGRPPAEKDVVLGVGDRGDGAR